jgi:hypothetical protein
MWLCTKYGFYSIVYKEDEFFHVRSRTKEDLEALIKATKGRFPQVETWPEADYRFRLRLKSEQYGQLMTTIFSSVSYSNFKGQIIGDPRQRDKYPVYECFHAAMEEYQNEKES